MTRSIYTLTVALLFGLALPVAAEAACSGTPAANQICASPSAAAGPINPRALVGADLPAVGTLSAPSAFGAGDKLWVWEGGVLKIVDYNDLPAGGGGGDDNQIAAEVPFTPAGSISADDVQEAIEELAAEKQPLAAPLTSLSTQFSPASGSGAAFLDFLEDTDNGSNRARLSGPASTADVTITLPAATDTLVGKATTDTFTNKTIDADGTGNSITNLENDNIKSAAAIDAAKIADGSISNTEYQRLNGVTAYGAGVFTVADEAALKSYLNLEAGTDYNAFDADLATLSTAFSTASGSAAAWLDFAEDTDNGSNRVRLIGPASTADVTLTLPAATDTLIGKATTDTLTNKTLDCNGSGNACSNIDLAADVTGDLPQGNIGDDAVGIDQLDLIDGDTPSNGECLTYDTGAGGSIEAIPCPGAGGGISEVVEDTSPQLGGDLNGNGFNIQFDDATGINDDSDNEQVVFQKTASAVNHLEVTNAATGNSPIIAAVGDDSNIGLRFQVKGSLSDPNGVLFDLGGGIYPNLTLLNSSDDVGGPYIKTRHLSATPAANDEIGGWAMVGRNDAAEDVSYGNMSSYILDPADGLEDGRIAWAVVTAGSKVDELNLEGAALFPSTDDGLALGLPTFRFSDLHLAEGGVINWDNGDCALTQTGNALATTGCTIPGASLDSASESATGAVELATAGEAETGTDTARAVTPAGLLAAISGKHTIYVPAGAMVAQTTAGCAAGTYESATSLLMYKSFDCDGAGSLQEGVQFMVGMPKSWDEGTLTARIDWTAASGSGNVIWLLSCSAASEGDAIASASFGSEVSITDALTTALDVHQSSESGAITPGGTPAENDNLWCRIQRDGDNASDTLNSVDARLMGARFLYTTNAFTDD